MATNADDTTTLLERKLALLRDIHEITRRELALVDLDELSPLLERKDELIARIEAIDGELARGGRLPPAAEALQREMATVVEAVLENERTLEARINDEHDRLRQELRDLDAQTRLRRYLEQGRPRGGSVDLRR